MSGASGRPACPDRAAHLSWRWRSCCAFKPALADLAVSVLAPMNDAMVRLLADEGHLHAVLAQGAERAAEIAGPVLRDAKRVVGFVA